MNGGCCFKLLCPDPLDQAASVCHVRRHVHTTAVSHSATQWTVWGIAPMFPSHRRRKDVKRHKNLPKVKKSSKEHSCWAGMWSLMTFTAVGNSETAVGDSLFTFHARHQCQVATISHTQNRTRWFGWLTNHIYSCHIMYSRREFSIDCKVISSL